MRIIETILDGARWAPSGDNTQPWRFEVLDDLRARVHGFDTRDHCVYDLGGWASRVSIGALLETASVAAAQLGRRLRIERDEAAPEARPRFLLTAEAPGGAGPDPLFDAIRERSVQRRPYARTPLTTDQRATLAAAAQGHEVLWLEGDDRQRMAALMFRSAWIRLTTPEAYAVHREIIEWGAQTSVNRVPDRALGVGAPTLAMMKMAMQSWTRVQFFNRFLAGTWLPRIQMDWLPAMACGAHFVILAPRPRQGLDDDFAAGRAMQRFWLTASRLGLSLQPEMTPLIFARYADAGLAFSAVPAAVRRAQAVRDRLAGILGDDACRRAVFMGRIGVGPPVTARSVRLELADLMHEGDPQ